MFLIFLGFLLLDIKFFQLFLEFFFLILFAINFLPFLGFLNNFLFPFLFLLFPLFHRLLFLLLTRISSITWKLGLWEFLPCFG